MVRRIFDPKMAISFNAVVESGSISAGAIACCVTQPWMSEQIRKLEQQLGGKLLVRTSRSLMLTEMGREFLQYARALDEANANAQQFAASLIDRQRNQLVIGACQYSAGLPIRAKLIEQLVRQYPNIEVEVRPGRSTDLVDMLSAGNLDMAIVHQLGITDRRELEQLLLIERHGFLMMRDDDQLAQFDEVPMSLLQGRELYIAPGRDDPVSMSRSLQPLIESGVVLKHCPDAERNVIESLAAENHGLCIAWQERDVPKPDHESKVYRRLSKNRLLSPIALARRADKLPSRSTRLAWEIAIAMTQPSE
jgi:DNA-binding transcriptional LysR family regulator